MKPEDKIVIISGKMGSGKTSLMKKLMETYSNSFRVENVIFAETIYRIHNVAYDIMESKGIARPKDFVKDGKLLQFLGTEWGRKTFGENVWVDCTRNEIENTSNSTETPILFFISDCRFKNELSGFPEAFKIRLECDREIRKERCSQWRENDTHPSEVDLDDCIDQFNLVINTGHCSPEETFEIATAELLNWDEAHGD